MLTPTTDLLAVDRERELEHVDEAPGDRDRVAHVRLVVETRIANSSPPSRAARSPSRIAVLDPVGDGDQELVAGGMAEGVVDDLEVVQVEEQDDRHPVRLPVAELQRRPAR